MWEPWIPTYAKIIHDHGSDFGFPGLEIDNTKFPNIASRTSFLDTRFYERYASRRLNQETLARWQLRLQNRFDEIAELYERAYSLYAAYREQMDKEVVDGSITLNSGTSTGKNETRSIDTPDRAVNKDKDYADRLSDTDTVNSHDGTVSFRKTGFLVENLNKSVYDFRDIDTAFIQEFENNFLNILWS